MSQSLTWSLNVAIVNGPQFSEAKTLTFDAYDKIDVSLPAGTVNGDAVTPATQTVEVQPGAAGQVQFLLLVSSVYDANLTYKVDGGQALKLDAPLMLGNSGTVTLIGSTQNKFVFSNAVSPVTPVSISILVGRKATA
jgi:hypothetical protein